MGGVLGVVDPTGSPWRRPGDACCTRTEGRWSAGGAIYRVRMDAHEARTAEAQQRAVAKQELAKSALRQAEIKRSIAEAELKLKNRELARKGRRGRMTVHEQAIENKLNALLVRLRRGYLPGEVMSTPSAPPAEVFASAQQNLQHHAAGGAAPAGRPAPKAGGSADGADDDGGGAGDEDDGEEDAAFRNYYRVTAEQRAFNVECKNQFKRSGANLGSAIFRPPDVLKKGCDRKLIGVGPCHVHAPHLYLGLPKPPCPKCGWASVDKGAVVTNGWCGARRVYAEGVDEWVIGQKLMCMLCKHEHDKAQEELNELNELNELEEELDEEMDKNEEVATARAAVKAASYVYRSYNSISMKIYAERYAWCG